MSKPPVAEQVQVNFRMPIALRDRIKEAAERNGRSMNAEIVASLDDRYPEPFTTADLGQAYREATILTNELDAAMRRWLRERDRAASYKSDYTRDDDR